jgi:hypothetical protein
MTMSQEEMVSHTAIRRTIDELAIAGDRQDAALFVAQFAEAATFELVALPPMSGFKAEGLDQIRGMTDNWKFLPKVKLVRHNITTCHIELTREGAASATSYFMMVSDNGLDHVGTYHDRFERGATRWLLTSRRVDTEWASSDSLYFGSAGASAE